jgi:hypothetical protein
LQLQPQFFLKLFSVKRSDFGSLFISPANVRNVITN